jgi:hypothetical protein
MTVTLKHGLHSPSLHQHEVVLLGYMINNELTVRLRVREDITTNVI